MLVEYYHAKVHRSTVSAREIDSKFDVALLMDRPSQGIQQLDGGMRERGTGIKSQCMM